MHVAPSKRFAQSTRVAIPIPPAQLTHVVPSQVSPPVVHVLPTPSASLQRPSRMHGSPAAAQSDWVS
jgi:hypothetical protein